ncbi:MAG: fructosamine kinase family protein [Nesterenkonia sp.]
MSFTKRAPASHPRAALVEAAGLTWLKSAEAVGGPAVVAVLGAESGLLRLQEVSAGRPSAAAAAEFGAGLARMHRSLDPPTLFGTLGQEHPVEQSPLFGPADHPLPMGTGQHHSWGTFQAQQRLDPVLQRLRPSAASSDWEVLIAARDRIGAGGFDDDESASLIHGDLWSGNVLWSPAGAVLIDPAAHAGHRESDIAMLQLFGMPYLDELLEAYQQTHPLRAGWQQRVPVHQLFYLAVHWLLFGSAYRGATVAAAQATAEL